MLSNKQSQRVPLLSSLSSIRDHHHSHTVNSNHAAGKLFNSLFMKKTPLTLLNSLVKPSKFKFPRSSWTGSRSKLSARALGVLRHRQSSGTRWQTWPSRIPTWTRACLQHRAHLSIRGSQKALWLLKGGAQCMRCLTGTIRTLREILGRTWRTQ